MKIEAFVCNDFQSKTHLIWDENSKEAIIIDATNFTPDENIKLKELIEKNELKVKYLLTTHCHIDHMFGNAFVKNTFHPHVYYPRLDKPLLDNIGMQASTFGLNITTPPEHDFYIEENMKLMIGDTVIKPLFTPGHTPGEYSFYIEEEKVCFTGDVLFKESIGRTDLWGGDYEALMNSIEKKLLSLPDDTVIYPGHGESSTIGSEKKNNPFLKEIL